MSPNTRTLNHSNSPHSLRTKINSFWTINRIRDTMLSMQDKIDTLEKPWAPTRKLGQKRGHAYSLKLTDAEHDQVDRIAKRLGWTKVDVIRNCVANGTKDLESFIDGCDSPLMECVWSFMVNLGGVDETERVKAAMNAIRQSRNDERVARKQQELDPNWEVRTA